MSSPAEAASRVKRTIVGADDVELSVEANEIINRLIAVKGLSYEEAAAACAEATSFFCDAMKAVK